MEQIEKAPLGVLLLWAVAVGLVALAIWQIAEAFLERNPDTKKKWGYRLKYLGTAVIVLPPRGPSQGARFAKPPDGGPCTAHLRVPGPRAGHSSGRRSLACD
jgi:hypothetical protein